MRNELMSVRARAGVWARQHQRAVGIGVTVSAMALLGIAAVLGWAVLNGQRLSGEAEATPTVQPTSSSQPTDGPSSSPTPTGSPAAPEGLSIDTIAVTLVDDLSVRDEPSTSGVRLGVLGPAGEAVFVVSGPVATDGRDWYQLASVWEPYQGGCEPAPEPSLRCHDWFGWAAGTGASGEPWLAPRPDSCPAPPLDTSAYLSLAPLERLACFGDQPWTLRAYMAPESGCRCGLSPYRIEPAWLGGWEGAVIFPQPEESQMDGSSALLMHVHPALGDCDFGGHNAECPFAALAGQWVEIIGHLDDPAASTCVAVINDWAVDQEGIAPPPDRDASVVDCRSVFVATGVTQIDAP
jgi:hypothetical protein